MFKKISVMFLLIFLITGCSVQYNLVINDDEYQEEIIIIGENTEEINNLNNIWTIPVNKDQYNIGLDSHINVTEDIYKYKLSNNKLMLSYNFDRSNIINSSAVSNCYKMLTVTDYDGKLIISTSDNIKCFDDYPALNSVNIKISVDRKVISNNADLVYDNNYMWNLTRNNSKGINLVLDNLNNEVANSSIANSSIDSHDNNNLNNYVFYIILGIFIIILISGYYLFNKMKKNADKMDD